MRNAFFTVCAICLLFLISGCQTEENDKSKKTSDNSSTEKETADSSTGKEAGENDKGQSSDHGHTHTDADKLHWPKENIQLQDYLVSLGHHGNHFHKGDSIEPAVMITKNGSDVVDATVFNSLVSADGSNVIAEEAKMVFEPKTESEPAHYAQGKLEIPKDSEGLKIRFRIKLPDVQEESVHEIELSAY